MRAESQTKSPAIWVLPVPTPDGEFAAHYSNCGLCALDFPARKPPASGVKASGPPPGPDLHAWHQATVAAVAAVLQGRSPAQLPPLDLSRGTDFQRSVWKSLQAIPPGRTRSYGEIAGQLGRPKAVRAVGGACGANPIPVLIPCHRVLAANQRLGGFSGGLPWKQKLLSREGTPLPPPAAPRP